MLSLYLFAGLLRSIRHYYNLLKLDEENNDHWSFHMFAVTFIFLFWLPFDFCLVVNQFSKDKS